MATSQLQFYKRNEQIANWSLTPPFWHLCRLIKVSMLAELILGYLNYVGISSWKFPALKGVLNKVNANNFCGNKNRFRMIAANNDARSCKKPCRFDTVPNLPGLLVAMLDKGFNRPACEMNVYQHNVDVVIEVRFIFIPIR